MITYLLYNRSTPAERWANDLAAQLKREQVTAELVDADSTAGAQMAEHYDVLARPAILVVRDDGSPAAIWQGQESLPVVADVVYAAHT